MADKKYDAPSQKGLRGLKNRLTKPADEDGKSYLSVAKEGFKMGALWPVSYRKKDGSEGKAYTMPLATSAFVAVSLPISMTMIGSVDLISPQHPDYDPVFSQSIENQEKANDYRAVSVGEDRYVLVEDESDTWRIYEYVNHSPVGDELRFVSDPFLAEAIAKRVSHAFEDTLEAYKSFTSLPENMPQEMEVFSASYPYEYKGEIFRAVSNSLTQENAPRSFETVFTQASSTWQEAANEIAAGGYGFTQDSTPVRFAPERPDTELMEVAPIGGAVFGGAILFLSAFTSACLGVGAGAERYMSRRPYRRARKQTQKSRGPNHGG